MFLARHYPDEHYGTVYDSRTGFFARVEDPGWPDPFWSQHGPELVDISITGWCDRECGVCYRECGPAGQHMAIEDYENILRQARAMHVAQVALGGGNPNQHPEFPDILQITREHYGIVPSYTTNGRGLTPEVVKASKKHCGAVAVSAYQPYEEMRSALNTLKKAGVKTNIHFVLDCESIATAIAWLEKPPGFLDGVNALIFLNYKPQGRSGGQRVLRESERVREFFKLATAQSRGFKIGFDTCLASGLACYTSADPSLFDACEAARFSMFVSERMRMYPCSFMEATREGSSVLPDNMLQLWQTAKEFVEVRSRLAGGGCPGCGQSDVCRCGCPMFPEINLCNAETRS